MALPKLSTLWKNLSCFRISGLLSLETLGLQLQALDEGKVHEEFAVNTWPCLYS